jgi:hypothetical protein
LCFAREAVDTGVEGVYRVGVRLGIGVVVFVVPPFHEAVVEGAAFAFGFALLHEFWGAELGFRGDDAVFGVEDDLFDGGEGLFRLAERRQRGLFGEIQGGELESVEQEAGAAGVDSVERDAAEDDADGGLDGGAVFGVGQDEGGLGGFGVGLELAALGEFGDGNGRAAGVVVEAK